MLGHVKYYGHHHLFDVLILFCFAALALVWFRRSTKWSTFVPPLPPGPRGFPLVGYLLFLISPNHLLEFSSLAKIYGPIFKFWMGTKLFVVITSPQLIGQVVREQDTVFANRVLSTCTLIATHGGNDIAFASYGPKWKKLRKIFAHEISTTSVLDKLYWLRKEEVRKSVKYLYEKIDSPVDIGSLAYQTSTNSIMRMTIGGSIEGDDTDIDVDQFRKMTEDLMALVGKPNISDVFPALKWFDIQGIERDSREITRVFEVMFNNAMSKRKKARSSTRKDFLQFLMELHDLDQDSKTPITMSEIKALLMDILLGATDTTTSSVEWAMAEIFKHPKVLMEIQSELKQLVGLNNHVEESHLSKLTYLNAVFKETLRLHPPGPFLLPRSPSKSSIVGGYTIPKGSTIFLNVWSIQRDPIIWENPLEFIPERFLRDEIQGSSINYNFSGTNFNYLPFGSGRRMCPGVSLGERMVMLILASFLHCFDWKLPIGSELELSHKLGFVVKKKNPLKAIPTPRFSDLELYSA